MSTVRTVPVIEQQLPVVHGNATHYGYCAFADINISDRQVQPPNSPYYHVLPKRTLIPFVRIDERDYDPATTMDMNAMTRERSGKDLTVVFNSKTAVACAEDVAYSYKEWGFVVLRALTGLSEQDAGDVFFTIQPFRYTLKDLIAGLNGAEERIAQVKAYDVAYEDETALMHPLREDLKPIARQVLAQLREAVSVSINYAEEKAANTQKNIQRFLAGSPGGKDNPDPLDHYIFAELGKVLPTMIIKDEKSDSAGLGDLVEALKQVGIGKSEKSGDIEELRAELMQELEEIKAIKEDWNARHRARFGGKRDSPPAAPPADGV